MPAIDRCEPQMIRAFQKSGWIVTHQPFAIKVDKTRTGYIFADLRLQRSIDHQSIIVVEVKCFESTRTALDEFYQAVGQYIVYRNALSANQILAPVYLAIPLIAYENFLLGELVQAVLKDIHMDLIVIDLEKEEVVEWIISSR